MNEQFFGSSVIQEKSRLTVVIASEGPFPRNEIPRNVSPKSVPRDLSAGQQWKRSYLIVISMCTCNSRSEASFSSIAFVGRKPLHLSGRTTNFNVSTSRLSTQFDSFIFQNFLESLVLVVFMITKKKKKNYFFCLR